MKSSLRTLLASVAVFFSPAFLSADAPEQKQVTLVRGSSETWDLGWNSIAPHRIFTVQATPDLVNWIYAPVFEFGLGDYEWSFESSPDKAFFRLKYEDHPEVETLEEAKLLTLDGTGMPGEWKVKNGLDPFNGTGVNSPDGDLDGDGVLNKADARPKDEEVGEAVISITSPANGASIN
jgi:hypothetical protein